METINTIKDAAIKAVWGTPDANKEPVSGRMGNTAAGEPYDAGNIEPVSTALKATNPNPDVEPASTPLKSSTTQSDTMTNAEFNKNANPSAASAELPPPTPSEKPAASNSQPDTNPAETKPSSSLPGDATHAQSDTRAPTNPLAAHHSESETDKPHPRTNVDDSGETVDKSDNPVKIDGPGPRPLEVVAKEHGGDAGAAAKREKEKGQRSSSVDTQEDQESGTGELYVRSSGLAADGGDFDAAKPGAGREADRLLAEERRHPHPRQTENDKEKHKHHISLPLHKKKDSGYEHGLEDEKDKTAAAGTGNGSAAHGVQGEDADVAHNWEIKSKKPGEVGKEKTSLKEKIKNKLHRSSVSSD